MKKTMAGQFESFLTYSGNVNFCCSKRKRGNFWDTFHTNYPADKILLPQQIHQERCSEGFPRVSDGRRTVITEVHARPKENSLKNSTGGQTSNSNVNVKGVTR